MDFFASIRWRPGIGDPTWMGWFTVFSYGLAAVLAAWTARRTSGERVAQGGPKVRTVWNGTAILLAFLCLNKQLDLQSLATDIARAIAQAQGWYGERRVLQKSFVLGVLGISAVFAFWFVVRFRLFWLRHALLVTGLFFLLTFIIVRAVSFHHFDEFLGFKLAGVRMNWLLELTGIYLVAMAALRETRKSRARTSPRASPAR